MKCERVQANSAREGGMALIVTLWVLTLLSLVAAAFMADSRTTSKLAWNLAENARAEALADAGLYRAVAALLDSEPARRPRTDGATYRWQFGGGEILISIQDEAGKIDLNRASDQLLEGLFVSVGTQPAAAKRLVQAIRDFADADQLKNSDGAEDDDYRAAGLIDGAKDAPFDTVAELQQVLGMNLDLYERVAPALTVYSGRRSIDPMTAPREALLAMPGAKQDQVDALIESRASTRDRHEPGRNDRSSSEALDQSATGESNSFDSLFDDAVSADDEAADPNEQSVRENGVYSITAVASAPDGGTFERLAVVRLTGDPLQPFVFREWRRSWASSVDKAASSEQE